MFVNRQPELAFLSSILERMRPTAAQLILLYGRRRVGKTVLLRHWAEHAERPHTYWAAEKEPAALQRRKFYARILGVEPGQAPTFDSWAECWSAIVAVLADRRHILILDEFTYAVDSDPARTASTISSGTRASSPWAPARTPANSPVILSVTGGIIKDDTTILEPRSF